MYCNVMILRYVIFLVYMSFLSFLIYCIYGINSLINLYVFFPLKSIPIYDNFY